MIVVFGGELSGTLLKGVSLIILIVSIITNELSNGIIRHTDIVFQCGWHGRHHISNSHLGLTTDWSMDKHTQKLSKTSYVFVLCSIALVSFGLIFRICNHSHFFYLVKYCFISGSSTMIVSLGVWSLDSKNDCVHNHQLKHVNHGVSLYFLCLSIILSIIGDALYLIGEMQQNLPYYRNGDHRYYYTLGDRASSMDQGIIVHTSRSSTSDEDTAVKQGRLFIKNRSQNSHIQEPISDYYTLPFSTNQNGTNNLLIDEMDHQTGENKRRNRHQKKNKNKQRKPDHHSTSLLLSEDHLSNKNDEEGNMDEMFNENPEFYPRSHFVSRGRRSSNESLLSNPADWEDVLLANDNGAASSSTTNNSNNSSSSSHSHRSRRKKKFLRL